MTFMIGHLGKGKVETMAKLPTGMRKRKDGGYEYRFSCDGLRYSVSGGSVEECKLKRKEKEKLLDAGIYHTNETITLDQYFKEWKAEKAANVGGNTLFMYQYNYDCSISPYIGKCKIRRLERRQVVDMMNRVAESGRYYPHPKKGKKAKAKAGGKKVGAANFARRLLVEVLNGAISDDIIQRNVAESVPAMKREKPLARETVHRELTDEELKIFFTYCRNSTHYPAFQFLLYTGVRAGECAALEWEDVDWKRSIIHIRRTITRSQAGKWVVGETTKTKTSKRDIPINANIRSVLEKQWKAYMEINGEINLVAPVFPNEHGGFAHVGCYGSVILQTLVKAQAAGKPLTKFGVHAFRDTFASRAIRAGVEPNTLKEILGHSSLAMTMDLYAHVNQEDKRRAMNALKVVQF